MQKLTITISQTKDGGACFAARWDDSLGKPQGQENIMCHLVYEAIKTVAEKISKDTGNTLIEISDLKSDIVKKFENRFIQ